MEKIKIAIGLAIIVASFVYILRNKSSMLDNLMKKSVEDYEKRKRFRTRRRMSWTARPMPLIPSRIRSSRSSRTSNKDKSRNSAGMWVSK